MWSPKRAAHHLSASSSGDRRNMTISIRHEMIVFWSAFLCGQAISIIFDFFRSLRKNTCPSRASVAIQDVMFCTISFKIFFDTLYVTNNGHLRWYIPVAIILSGIIYFCTESKYVVKTWCFIFKIMSIILTPVFKILALLKKLLQGALKSVKMRFELCICPLFSKIRQIATKKLHKPHENKDLI